MELSQCIFSNYFDKPSYGLGYDKYDFKICKSFHFCNSYVTGVGGMEEPGRRLSKQFRQAVTM